MILISRRLLRMHGLYLASFVRMNGMHRTQSDRARFYILSHVICSSCFDHLSHQTCAKHSIGARPLIAVARTPFILWLLLVDIFII